MTVGGRIEPSDLLRRMTEEEFDAWSDEDRRAEFVDGEVIPMSPAHILHIRAARFLLKLLDEYLVYRPVGEILGTEFQVRLRAGLRRVPDLLFVAAEHSDRLGTTLLDGAPDAAWEIISPESVERDCRVKYREYEASGVEEYWIVDPFLRTVTLNRLRSDGRYVRVEEEAGRLVSQVVEGFWLKPEWLWQEPRPAGIECLREMGVIE